MNFMGSPPSTNAGASPFVPVKAEGTEPPRGMPSRSAIVGNDHPLVCEPVALLRLSITREFDGECIFIFDDRCTCLLAHNWPSPDYSIAWYFAQSWGMPVSDPSILCYNGPGPAAGTWDGVLGDGCGIRLARTTGESSYRDSGALVSADEDQSGRCVQALIRPDSWSNYQCRDSRARNPLRICFLMSRGVPLPWQGWHARAEEPSRARRGDLTFRGE